MAQKELEVVLTLTEPPCVKCPRVVSGWGDNGYELCVTGAVAQIRVSRNGEGEFSLRILEDGRLILTNYSGTYETVVERNLMLKPSRLWEGE